MTLLTLLFLAATSSQAATPEQKLAQFCPDIGTLSKAVKVCQLNPYFVRSAEACLKKLKAETDAQTAALTAAMGAANQASASAQAAKISNQNQNLTSTKASLEELLAVTKLVRSKVVEYRENFMRAGKVNKTFAKRLGPAFLGILESFPCYKDNYALITRYVTALDAKAEELRKTLDGVGGLNARTLAAGKSINNDSTSHLKAAGNTKANGGAPEPGATRAPASNGKSSITGVDEDETKRAKK